MRRKERSHEDDFDIELPLDEPLYPLNIVCRLLGINSWTVNDILKEGLIHPKKVGKRKKLFSYQEIRRLKYIKYLIEDEGVNIKGVKIFIEMEEEG